MKLNSHIITFLILLLLFLMWHSISYFEMLPNYVLATPIQVIAAIKTNFRLLLDTTSNTILTALAGFVIAFVFGLTAGIIMQRSNTLYRILLPCMVSIKSIPIIALVPLVSLIIGVGWTTKLFLTFLICFFPMVVTAYSGLLSVPDGLKDFAGSVCTSKLRYFVHLNLPSATNQLLIGMKITVPLAFVGAVVSEMSGGDDKGIGYVIMTASYTLDTPLLYASMFILALAAAGTFYLVNRTCALLRSNDWEDVLK